MYRTTIFDNENLNLDAIWTIIDWYKLAVLRTREVSEVEQEAIALSRLGRVYGQVLKIKSMARQYLHTSIELALSVAPRTFNNDGMFFY